MRTYAMIVNGKVTEVLINQEVKPDWPPTIKGTNVVAVECTDDVHHGMLYNPETNSFSEYIPEPIMEPEYIPTENEIIMFKLTNIESMMTEDREAAINEAIDAFTLELMTEGII